MKELISELSAIEYSIVVISMTIISTVLYLGNNVRI